MNINDLISGHEKFKAGRFKKYQNKFIDLIKNGQHPKVMFIACSDSRINPSLITDSDPGELFMVRNIGNFCPPYAPDNGFHSTAAAIEYGVSVLEVSDIIVCGHSHCGAIDCVYDIPDSPNLVHVRKWLELGIDAKNYVNERVPEDIELKSRMEMTEKVSVLFQLNNLLTYPEIKRKVATGELSLRGWYYHIISGKLEYYDDVKKAFLPMDSEN